MLRVFFSPQQPGQLTTERPVEHENKNVADQVMLPQAQLLAQDPVERFQRPAREFRG